MIMCYEKKNKKRSSGNKSKMIVVNSSIASFLIINQSSQLVDVMWFGRLFEKSMKSFTLRPFPLKSQEGSKGFLS